MDIECWVQHCALGVCGDDDNVIAAEKKTAACRNRIIFPIAVGVGVFVVCYFLCYMLHEVFMSVRAGFLVVQILATYMMHEKLP